MNIAFGIFCLSYFALCLAGAVRAWVESESAVRRSTADDLLEVPVTELSTRLPVSAPKMRVVKTDDTWV